MDIESAPSSCRASGARPSRTSLDTRVPLARAACAHVTLLGLKPVEIKTLESLTSPCLSEATLPWRAQSFVTYRPTSPIHRSEIAQLAPLHADGLQACNERRGPRSSAASRRGQHPRPRPRGTARKDVGCAAAYFSLHAADVDPRKVNVQSASSVRNAQVLALSCPRSQRAVHRI